MPSAHPNRIRVLLVDDHPAVLEAVRLFLVRDGGCEVVGEAFSGTEAVRRTRELQPDVVLMDIAMSGMSGLEATRCLRETCPASRVLLLTAHEGWDIIAEMMRSGARGCLRKGVSPAELLSAIEQVHAGALAFGQLPGLGVTEEPATGATPRCAVEPASHA